MSLSRAALPRQDFSTQKVLPFIDLQAQSRLIRKNVDAAISKVLDHGQYIMGPEVFELERQLCDYTGAKYTLSCSNGTDALVLALMAKKVQPGDAIFVPTFTFAATAEVVPFLGATPVFVDVNPDTFNMCPESLSQAIETAEKQGLRPAGVIAVDLFGLPADFKSLEAIALAKGLWYISDAAQSFGATLYGKRVGTFGDITTTSFFPAKPLGCYGDGGAIFTDDASLAEEMTSLRIHGQGKDKYDNIKIGMNGRLDTIQAAILIEKLKIFPHELIARNQIAERYHHGIKDIVKTPVIPEGYFSSWAQYTIRLPKGADRGSIVEHLKAHGIPSVIYYAIPLHLQKAYHDFPRAAEHLVGAETLATEVLSLPMHPYLAPETQEFIIQTLRACL